MASAMKSISTKQLLAIRSSEHIVNNAYATDTQIVMADVHIVMPGRYSHYKVPRYGKDGTEDPLFQPVLTTLNTEEYTTDMKITRINIIKQQGGAK